MVEESESGDSPPLNTRVSRAHLEKLRKYCRATEATRRQVIEQLLDRLFNEATEEYDAKSKGMLRELAEDMGWSEAKAFREAIRYYYRSHFDAFEKE